MATRLSGRPSLTFLSAFDSKIGHVSDQVAPLHFRIVVVILHFLFLINSLSVPALIRTGSVSIPFLTRAGSVLGFFLFLINSLLTPILTRAGSVSIPLLFRIKFLGTPSKVYFCFLSGIGVSLRRGCYFFYSVFPGSFHVFLQTSLFFLHAFLPYFAPILWWFSYSYFFMSCFIACCFVVLCV